MESVSKLSDPASPCEKAALWKWAIISSWVFKVLA